jgi:hypothetical protein
MLEVENAIATPLEDFDLIVETFHKTAILSLDKVVRNFLPPTIEQFQEIIETIQATILNLLDPNSDFGLSLLLGQVLVEDRCELFP